MSRRLTMMVSSPPDRDHLVAEIWSGDVQMGELSRSSQGLVLELYGHPYEGHHLLELEDVQRVLAEAAEELQRHEADGSAHH